MKPTEVKDNPGAWKTFKSKRTQRGKIVWNGKEIGEIIQPLK